jgi:hydroxylamine reductase (hybrid-cluster protein)
MEKNEITTTQNSKNSKEQNLDFMELLGIKIDDGKIEIDTNTTKSFFESLQKKVQEKANDIEDSIKNKNLNLKDSVGVKIEENKIELDLNKTKSFLNDLSDKVKSFVDSIDSTIEDIAKKGN